MLNMEGLELVAWHIQDALDFIGDEMEAGTEEERKVLCRAGNELFLASLRLSEVLKKDLGKSRMRNYWQKRDGAEEALERKP